MRRAVLVWLLCVGCAPDTAHTAFLCIADGDCPSEQFCVAGRCRRASALRGDGVICGNATCASDEACCVDDVNPPRCLAAASPNCPGLIALCDGHPDCAGSDRCCGDDGVVTCGTDCAIVVCQVGSDCPNGRPNCCKTDATVRWGQCQLAPC